MRIILVLSSVILLLALLLISPDPRSAVAAAPASQPQAPFIDFSWSQGFSPFKTTAVRITPDGKVSVTYEKYDAKPKSFKFSLNEDEFNAIAALVTATGALDLHTDKNAVPGIDTGLYILTLHVGARTETLKFSHSDQLAPLTGALWKLINQAVVTTELEHDGNIYAAVGACSSDLVGPKVYCPYLLIAPMKAFAEKCDNRQKLGWALEGLSWELTEQQWLGYISAQIQKAKPDRKALLLTTLCGMPFHDDIAPAQSSVLLPYFTGMLQRYATQQATDEKMDNALGAVCSFIADRKYEPALPALKLLAQRPTGSDCHGYADYALEIMAKKSPTPEIKTH